MSTSIEFISYGVEQTIQLGQQIGQLLQAGDVICLSGNLGAGKTALTRGIGAGWGAQEAITSPTFTLIHEHRRSADGQLLYHVDCYRLSNASDAWGIGLDDLLYDENPVVIEWPENIQAALPDDRLWIELDFITDKNRAENQRQLTITATGARYEHIADALHDYLSD